MISKEHYYHPPSLSKLQMRDFNTRDGMADQAWFAGVQAEKEHGLDAAAPLYESSLRHRIGAVWWHKEHDPELDYSFYLKLGEVQSRLAAYSGLAPGDRFDRNTAYFEAAEKVYDKAKKRLLNNPGSLDDIAVNSLEALILSRRADMYTAWGHFNDAKEDLDVAESDITSSVSRTSIGNLILEQIPVQREIITGALENNVRKAEPQTPPGFLLYIVTNSELVRA